MALLDYDRGNPTLICVSGQPQSGGFSESRSYHLWKETPASRAFKAARKVCPIEDTAGNLDVVCWMTGKESRYRIWHRFWYRCGRNNEHRRQCRQDSLAIHAYWSCTSYQITRLSSILGASIYFQSRINPAHWTWNISKKGRWWQAPNQQTFEGIWRKAMSIKP